MQFSKITLVGVGLLGGSLGLALQKRGLAREVTGFVRRPAAAAECERLGITHNATSNLLRAVTDADVVIFCTPIGQMAALARESLPGLKPGALITDVGSVKAPLVEQLEPIFASAGARFIGSHPMAGSERTGMAAAVPEFFEEALCVLTPTARTAPETIREAGDFWRALGARVLSLSPAAHDEYVSRASHLPHVVAAELANYVLSPVHPPEQARLCATGFRDTTRIASGSPEMWRDIVLANRGPLARVLGVFIEDLQEFRHALETGDVRAIEEFFSQARRRRDEWCATRPEGRPAA